MTGKLVEKVQIENESQTRCPEATRWVRARAGLNGVTGWKNHEALSWDTINILNGFGKYPAGVRAPDNRTA